MLPAGAQVRVVLTPTDGSQASTDPEPGGTPSVLVDRATIYSVDASPDDESVHVAIEVDEADSAEVLRASAGGRVGLVLLGGEGMGS
jgi:hypothetical protein